MDTYSIQPLVKDSNTNQLCVYILLECSFKERRSGAGIEVRTGEQELVSGMNSEQEKPDKINLQFLKPTHRKEGMENGDVFYFKMIDS